MSRGWKELLQSLGVSLLEVFGAETEALKADLRSTGRMLAATIGLGLMAAAFLFWSVGVAGLVFFEVLTLWLPRWGAALTVLASFLLLTGLFAWLTKLRLQKLEPPGNTVRRHIDDHLEWWQGQVKLEGAETAERSDLQESP